MKAARIEVLSLAIVAILISLPANGTQLLLSRDAKPPEGEFKGLIDIVVAPGFDNAAVAISVDGQRLVDALHVPYRLTIDLGANAVEHKIVVTAYTMDKRKRVQWSETINRGMLPLTVKVQPVDLANRLFEAVVTAPKDDPVSTVELWDDGKAIATVTEAPYRFTIPAGSFAQQFVQVTARTKSGEEAADFWSAAGDVHVESMDVRTVPIYVSVVDPNGSTRDDIDRSLFRIIDDGTEAKILEFGKAFDQPISIALLIDASSSMLYSMSDATKAALSFAQHTLKQGDRCAVYSIRETPRREQPLTDDLESVAKAIKSIRAIGRTSLYDAIQSATREIRDEKARRAIVILTDGGDTSSMMTFDEIDKLATEAGIPLYFIAYESGDPTEEQDLNRMKYLAGQTGGFVATANAENLQSKYNDIEKDLRAQYAIRYQVADFAKHNQWRKIHVMLNSPKLTARTIRGYFAP